MEQTIAASFIALQRRIMLVIGVALAFLLFSPLAAAQQDDAAPDDPSAPAEVATSDEIVEALKSGDLSAAMQKSSELLTRYGPPAVFVIILIVVAYFFASFLARLGSAPIRTRLDETLGRFVRKLIFYGIMVCVVLGALQYFGVGITSFAAILAAAGFAIGLAFQGTLSNFSAGIMLLVFRPFKVGDVVTAAGLTAKVNEIDLFTTTFDTFDNRRFMVPNSSITGGTIENITFHQHRRVDVSVGVAYAADLKKTRETLTAAAQSLGEFLIEGEGRGYQVVLSPDIASGFGGLRMKTASLPCIVVFVTTSLSKARRPFDDRVYPQVADLFQSFPQENSR